MNARGCYGNNHFTRNVYGYAFPYVGQESSPAPSASPTPPALPDAAQLTQLERHQLTPGEMNAVRAHWRAMGFYGDAAGPSRSSGGYSSVLGRMLVVAAGAFLGYQASSPSNRTAGIAIGAASAAFLNVLQQQANTLDRIAANIRRG